MNEARRQRYARAKPIALAALDLPLPQRSDFVESACVGDASLAEEVEWILHAAENTSDMPFMPTLFGDPHNMSGSSVVGLGNGRYRIRHLLGEGGMGVVYLADRLADDGADAERTQRVALKFINVGQAISPIALKRFAEERRILARLDHPGIVKLIDGSGAGDGRPFLAMEYVEGERIDQWCDRLDLPLRQRVALFLKVCAAVCHAHDRMVIHRDIKPANILVTADGEPKLLDFGIARLLEHVGGFSATQTLTLQRALTLGYASPEQLRGEVPGERADVWSLGVVLYQLVCGERPFAAVNTDSLLDVSHAIVTGPLLAPSRRISRHRRGWQNGPRDVPADMDAIVMKALRRNPMERYASVAELSADLAHFLDLQPVRARRGHALRCIGSFLRQHRIELGVAAMFMVMAVAFGFERVAQLHRVEIERDKAREIAGFMQDLLEHADSVPADGSQISMRQALDHGVTILSARTDVAPEVRVSLVLSMAKSYNQLGLGAPAIRLLEHARNLQRTFDATRRERSEVVTELDRAYSILLDCPPSVATSQGAAKLPTRTLDRRGWPSAKAADGLDSPGLAAAKTTGSGQPTWRIIDYRIRTLSENSVASAGPTLPDSRSGNCSWHAWVPRKFTVDAHGRVHSGAPHADVGCPATASPIDTHCPASCE